MDASAGVWAVVVVAAGVVTVAVPAVETLPTSASAGSVPLQSAAGCLPKSNRSSRF